MKSILTIFFLFHAIATFCQNQDIYIHPHIIAAVKKLQKKGIDTIFVYHESGYIVVSKSGEDCKDIVNARVVWTYRHKVYSKRLYCDNRRSKPIQKGSEAYDFFKKNLNGLRNRPALPNGEKYPFAGLDSPEEAFYMRIQDRWHYIFLDEVQKEDVQWHKYEWVNLGIKLSQLNKAEMQ